MFKHLILSILILSGLGRAAVPSVTLPLDWTSAAGISRSNLNLNPIALRDGINVAIDSLNPLLALMSGFSSSLAIASNQDLILKVDADANGSNRFVITANNIDTLFRITESDSAAKFTGPLTVAGTSTLTGVATLAAAPVMSALSASLPVVTNGSKALASASVTGTGTTIMMSASPTTTGTLTGAAANFSGAVSTAALSSTSGAFSSTVTIAGAGIRMDNAQGITMKNAGGTYRQVMALQSDNTLDIGGTVDGGIRFLTNLGNTAGTVTTAGAWSLPSTLAVTGDVTLSNATSGGPLLTLTSTDAGGRSYILASGGSANGAFPTGSFTLRDATAGTNRLTISSAGLVAVTGAATVGSTLGVTGVLTANSGAVVGATPSSGGLVLRNGTDRWNFYLSGAESGSNAGSTLNVAAYTDGGVFIDNALSLARAAGGTVTIARPTTLSSTLGVTGVSTLTGNVLLGGKISNGASYLNATYNAEATTTDYFQANNGGTVITRFGAPGATAYNYLNLNTILGTDASPSYKLDVRGTFGATGAATLGSTLGVTGVATFTAAPVFSSVTASQFLLVDGSKALTSVTGTGSGSVVRATSPTITTPTFSGTIASGLTASRTVTTDGSGNFAINTETGTGAHMKAASPTTTGTLTADAITASGITTANGGLTLGARFVDKTTSITSNTTLGTSHSTVFADATSGSITLTLPAVAGNTGLTYTVYKNDASTNTITLDGNASETLDGITTEVLGGNLGNSVITIICTGSAWRIRELRDVGQFTMTATGVSGSVTGTAGFSRIGRDITLIIPGMSGTSNSTAFTLTGIPSYLQPTGNPSFVMDGIVNNGLDYVGYGFINSAFGYIEPFFRSSLTAAPGNTYTSSGTKGIASNVIHYVK